MQRKSERVGGRNSGEGEHVRLRLAVNYLPFKYLTSTHAPIIPTKTPNQKRTQNEPGKKKRIANSHIENNTCRFEQMLFLSAMVFSFSRSLSLWPRQTPAIRLLPLFPEDADHVTGASANPRTLPITSSPFIFTRLRRWQ